jgi:hypothetical protein
MLALHLTGTSHRVSHFHGWRGCPNGQLPFTLNIHHLREKAKAFLAPPVPNVMAPDMFQWSLL